MPRPILLCLLTLFTFATSLSAQGVTRSTTERLQLGLSATVVSLDSDDLEVDESGGGLSIQVGWGFSRLFTLLIDGSAAQIDGDDDEFMLVHADLLGRFSFAGSNRAFVPFIEAGFTARSASNESVEVEPGSGEFVDLEISGGGFTFGGGFNYFVSPRLALGANIKWTSGEFNKVRVENITIDGFEIDATSMRLNLGLTWYPMGPR